jgi:hypothetical protein
MEAANLINPELLVLVPVLYAVGAYIKSGLKSVNNKHIPLILGVLGIGLSAFYVLGVNGNEYENLYLAIWTIVIQGILCAATAVYGNQVWRQYRGEK